MIYTPKDIQAETALRNRIADIIRDGVTYSAQTDTVLIHGAIDQIVNLVYEQLGLHQIHHLRPQNDPQKGS